jgi:tRNA (cytidine/uridine-2'-O-)-methyltransferase
MIGEVRDDESSLSLSRLLQCTTAGQVLSMFRVVLYEPEIPPNTGNVIRLCANAGAELHLVGPLGFELDDARLRRAGLDYREFAEVRRHDTLSDCLEGLGRPRVFACSTRGSTPYDSPAFRPGDTFLFGPETRGLPQVVIDRLPPARRLAIPMRPDNRSLNLSNAVAVVVYEAWRQQRFAGSGRIVSPSTAGPGG